MSIKPTPSFYPGDGVEGSTEPQEPVKLFDVVVHHVVGSVYAGGSENARLAAFRLIAMEETDGDYMFPDEDGRIVMVTVDTEKGSR